MRVATAKLIWVHLIATACRMWDMSEVSQAQVRSLAGQSHVRAASVASSKRMSVLKSVMGGGGGASGRQEQQADVHSVSCVMTVKPGDRRDKRVEVASFAALAGPLFAADTFVVCSRTGTFGVYKVRGGRRLAALVQRLTVSP